MEAASKFYIVLVIIGGFAGLFLTIGLFSQAWIAVNVEGNEIEGSIRIGLFSVRGCVDKPMSMCMSKTYGELDDEIKANLSMLGLTPG